MAVGDWLVYRIQLPTGHTYIGMTSCLYVRMLGHASKLRKGKLGIVKVPATQDIDVQILNENLDWSAAYAEECKFIMQDKASNPLNCNKQVSRFARIRTN